MTSYQRNYNIRRSYNAGVPVSEIANRYGLSVSQTRDIARYIVAQPRVDRDRYRTEAERDAYWTGLYNGGLSYREVALVTGHPYTTVRGAINRYYPVLFG